MIVIIGFSIGMYFEYNRSNSIIEQYKNYEVQSLDLTLQNYYYQTMDETSCQAAIKQNFIFADDIYAKGLLLEKYEEANQISSDLLLEKKRYVLLKTELWLNSILLKKKCNQPFDTVVYFYSADPSDVVSVAQQKIISNVLKTVKENEGNKIVLLPIAGDMQIGDNSNDPPLGIVAMQERVYNVTKFPSILINEKILLEGFHTQEEIQSYLNNRTNSSN